MGVLHPHLPGEAVESTNSLKPHQSPHSKENSQKPPHKDEESSKPGNRTSGTSSPWCPHSISTSKTSHKSKLSPLLPSKEQRDKHNQEKHSPWPKEWKDKCNCEDHNIPTKPKESFHSEKDRWSSDKDSGSSTSQGSHKCHPSPCSSSLQCSKKEACIDSSNHSSGKSPWARYQSPTRSMRDYNDHLYFVTPRNASTPHKSVHQLHNHSSSMGSRCLHTPLD